AFLAGLEVVDDVGRGLRPSQGGGARGAFAGEGLLHDVVQLAERAGLHTIESRNTDHDVRARVGRQVRQHFGGLVGLEVGENNGNDLRMLETDQLRYGASI